MLVNQSQNLVFVILLPTHCPLKIPPFLDSLVKSIVRLDFDHGSDLCDCLMSMSFAARAVDVLVVGTVYIS